VITSASHHATIFALATPPGRSAIAVVRISGPQTGAILDAMAAPRARPRFAALRKLRDPASGEILDEAIVFHFAAPKTETGEEMAELQLHGGKAIVRAVLDALAVFPGCRPAEPGEFAKRAFDNGKLDLAQIEGLADLIDAETQGQRQQAIGQATGLQSARFEAWRSTVLKAMGLVEAAIDFSDESDVSDRAVAQAEQVVTKLAAELTSHLDDGHRGEILRDGYHVVLAGPPNAGKSSLLNALARRDAAIVSEEAGTTRDVIDVRLDLEGVAVIVSDTAGIRETTSTVEQEGIRRTLQATREADLVVWLSEAANRPQPDLTDGEHGRKHRAITVMTKSDLLSDRKTIHVKHLADFAISAKTGAGIDDLTGHIAKLARDATGNASDPAITRVRHRLEIEAAIGHLRLFLADKHQPLELRAEDLRLAGTALGRLTGRIDAEEVLGEIFSRFCIGK
jgi:tRNA modification GTPase